MMEDCISSPLDFGLDQIICFGQFNVDGCERNRGSKGTHALGLHS